MLHKIFTINRSYVWLILALLMLLLFYITYNHKGNNAASNFGTNDVVVLLDVSKSMLANDIVPSRLEKALLEITNLVKEEKINRIALITFSKLPNMLLPLTNNKDAALQTIKNINNSYIETTSDANAALHLANGIVNGYEATNNHILVFTDGEMQQPIKNEIVEKCAKANIKIWVNIMGTLQGGNIIDPAKNDFVKDENNKLVVSKIDVESFKNITTQTQGSIYTNANAAEIASAFGNKTEYNMPNKKTKNSFFWLYLTLAFLIGEFIFTFFRKPKYFKLTLVIAFCLANTKIAAQNYGLVNIKELEKLMEHKQFDDAEKLIANATKKDTMAYKLFNAIIIQRANKQEQALKEYELLINKTDSIGLNAVVFNKALAFYSLQNFDLCIEQCKWLLLKNDKDTDARILLQMALKKKKEEEDKGSKDKKENKKENPLPENWKNILKDMNLEEQRIKRQQNSVPEKKGERNW